eukprot:CAMPEP_0177362214 /NCGR_PEP_ID=MMETSP0368-20130122/37595_1 /TAXON_ID=447022 ORGANISM="Scrippsiella hangoei-like, Strain SHHI-4" /NCGR_SAMPLE_ID=MMETSP0368 /ASSEMBLY_ACC=CAM_ASM_000363 /LENGTH=55 /DNA_ID=CAMNT_0018824909 /DNA_START=154 /DNA_END=318 /DNA_ORIENTATION=-
MYGCRPCIRGKHELIPLEGVSARSARAGVASRATSSAGLVHMDPAREQHVPQRPV